MSAAPKFPSDLGYAGLRMTADEFFALGETQDRYELIDGVVVMSPSATPRHWRVVRHLTQALELWNPAAEYFVEIDVRLGGRLVYCPDLTVYAPGRLAEVPERLTEAPDLVVEVLSPGNKATDLITKRADYERFGVREYWVFEAAGVLARAWRREGGAFVEHASDLGVLRSAALPGLTIDLAAFAGL